MSKNSACKRQVFQLRTSLKLAVYGDIYIERYRAVADCSSNTSNIHTSAKYNVRSGFNSNSFGKVVLYISAINICMKDMFKGAVETLVAGSSALVTL